MKSKKKKQSESGGNNNEIKMLQRTSEKRRHGNSKTSATRRKFIEIYEQNFGNVSHACEEAGIGRATFYRWMKSSSRINLKFQQKIENVKPGERQLDFAEAMLMKRIAQGDTHAIIFALKTRGRSRGYELEKQAGKKPDEELFIRVATAYQNWLEDHPQADEAAKNLWLERFATGSGVESREIAKRVGIAFYEVGPVQ